MSDAFIQSPGRAFVQSPCRAREGLGGAFIFQFIKSGVFAHNTDQSPWGALGGQNPAIQWPDPMSAVFTAAPVPGVGATIEQWGCTVPFPEPLKPPLTRGGQPYSTLNNPQFPGRATKSGFSWTTQGFPPHTWTILVAYRQHRTYQPAFSLPGGTYDDVADRFKIFPAASGVATYHTIPDTGFISGGLYSGFGGPTTIPLWHKTKRKDAGDPATEFFPDPPVTTSLDLVFPNAGTVKGTVELCLFWFERTEADLPIFPYLLDPSVL